MESLDQELELSEESLDSVLDGFAFALTSLKLLP